MSECNGTVYFITKAVFDRVAELEGEELDRYKVHSVDREAMTLMVGGTRFQASSMPKFVEGMRPLSEGYFIMDEIEPAAFDMPKPRGAQWKRETCKRGRFS